MKSDIFEKMTLNELRDIFLVKVTELMKLTEQRDADAYRIRDLKQEIDRLQAIMNFKKVTQN